MMTSIKKLPISLVTFFLTTSIVSTVEAIAIDKRTRCHGGWYVEGEGFYARAKDTFLTDFPTGYTDDTIPNEENIRLFHLHTKYNPGYRAAIGYDFPTCSCCNYGFSLEYTHFNNADPKNVYDQISETDDPALFPYDAFFLDSVFTTSETRLEYRYNTIDLLGHKNFTVCNCVDLQVFAGARYLDLKERYHNHLFVQENLQERVISADSHLFDLNMETHNRFCGIGPRIGANIFYQIWCGFGLTTEAAGNLIFGSSRDHYSEIFVDKDYSVEFALLQQSLRSLDTFRVDPESHRESIVTPGFSGKIALSYRAIFSSCSSLVVEAGYRGDKYFGLIDHSAFIQTIESPQSDLSSTNSDRNSAGSRFFDFDLAGPYVSITFHA